MNNNNIALLFYSVRKKKRALWCAITFTHILLFLKEIMSFLMWKKGGEGVVHGRVLRDLGED